jgi:hypothetical protein
MDSLGPASYNDRISKGSRPLAPREGGLNILKMGKIAHFQVEDGL